MRLMFVSCDVCRKVKEETATGTASSSKVRTTLTLALEGIEFDTAACTLRVKGIIFI